MRDETVAKNYAETLFELAHRNDGLEQYGQALHTVADLIDQELEVQGVPGDSAYRRWRQEGRRPTRVR